MFDDYLLPRIEDMPKITRQQFCDEFDSILERVEKEKISFFIEDAKEKYVLCPASLLGAYNDSDFGIIVNSAVRYSIGRHTYMPGVVSDFVIRNIDALSTHTLSIIVSDINREFEWDPNLDYAETWSSLRSSVEAEIALRNNRKKHK